MRYLLLLFITLPMICHATVYKRVLPNGQVVYTDKPGPQSAEVKLKPLSATMSSPQPSLTTQSSASGRNQTPPPPPKVYQLTLLSPTNDVTIRNNEGLLKVSGRLQPASPGVFELLLNGAIVDTQNQPHFTLTDTPRGSHRLQIQFKDKSGKLIASSPITTVHMHRASVLNR